MMTFLIACLTVAALLKLWFGTNVLVAYASLLGLTRRAKMDEWIEARKENARLDYLPFLLGRYPRNFFIQLITCPYCLGLWLSMAVCCCIGRPFWFLAVYAVALRLHREI